MNLIRCPNTADDDTDFIRAHTLLTATAKWLRTISSAAAASLAAGRDETPAMVRLGVPKRKMARSLRNASVETTRKHYAPGAVQESAGIICERLTVPKYSRVAEST